MFIDLYSQPITVFLAAVTPDIEYIKRELQCVLGNARIQAFDGDGLSLQQAADAMANANCSVHILGSTDIYSPDTDGYNSAPGQQFRIAKERCGKDFKMFVWNPSANIESGFSYINHIRRDIVENTVYSDKPSPILFVEEIRNILNVKKVERRKHEPADIFFMYNELDSDSALGVYNMLKDFQRVEKLGISMSSDVDYNTYICAQLADSKIGVVYYNFAADWAVSFARQVWKDAGGNSSSAPLFITGNSEHADPHELAVFDGVIDYTVNEQLRIPLDIKVFLDKISNE